MDVKQRQNIERQIISKLVTDILGAGYTISVDDGAGEGEEWALIKSTNHENIMAVVMQTDEDVLYVYKQDGTAFGWVKLVYGNDGWDVISDYTINLESVLRGPNHLASKLEEKYG